MGEGSLRENLNRLLDELERMGVKPAVWDYKQYGYYLVVSSDRAIVVDETGYVRKRLFHRPKERIGLKEAVK